MADTPTRSPDAGGAVRLPRGRRYAVRGLLIAATVLAVVAIFAVWANRQLLNADNWASTSSDLLANQQIRTAVSAQLVDEVYSSVNVPAELQSALPPRLAPLAGPAANGLRTLAQRTTEQALGRPRVQQAWETANRVTAQQFINVAEGKSGALTSTGNAVVLDLRVILVDVVARLGLPGRVVGRIPPTAGRIKIMSGNQVTALQDGASAVRGLSVVLPLLAFGLLALAVWLARGRRRETLFWAGWALVLAGAIVLIGRALAGDAVVNSLTTTAAAAGPAHAAWKIGTELLRTIAQSTILAGIPLIVAAWLAGPTEPAVATRRAMAPWLRERPAVAYGVAGLALLLFVWWEPVAAAHKPLAVLVIALLLAAGVAVLRRQTQEEFPDVTVEGAHAALRARTARWRQALPSRLGGAASGAPAAAAGTPGAPAAAPVPAASGATPVTPAERVAALERLAELHDRGVLSDAEFAAEKRHLLDGHGVGAAP